LLLCETEQRARNILLVTRQTTVPMDNRSRASCL
jgi:hypothetical protein